jgi:hypothetical protein
MSDDDRTPDDAELDQAEAEDEDEDEDAEVAAHSRPSLPPPRPMNGL